MSLRSTAGAPSRAWRWPPESAATTLAGLAGLAGLIGPPLFVLGVIVQQAYRGSAYSPTRQEISALTAGGAGWAQQLNFVVFGLLVIAFAAGLHRSVATERGGIVGPALLAINGLQLVIAGVFPLRQNDTGMVYDPIGMHTANGAVFFIGLGIPLITMSLRLRRDPWWRPLARYVLGTGIALGAAVVLVVTLTRPAGSALHPWQGTAQRVLVVTWLACIVTMALRLRRRGNAHEPAGQADDTPPWVKKLTITTAVVAGLIAAMMFFGGRHGPGMHGPGMHAGAAGTDTPRLIANGRSR